MNQHPMSSRKERERRENQIEMGFEERRGELSDI